MTCLERYLAGEHEQVWAELRALGNAIRREPVLSDARAVAAEMMRRVRRNLQRIVARLEAAGYTFGLYPDGTDGYYSDGPLVPLSGATRAEAIGLAERLGPLPLSLEAFWNEVGCVDLVGMHPAAPELLDPLVVHAPEGKLAELDDWEADCLEEGREGGTGERFEAELAPDDLIKDNISGGPAYSVALPEPAADFVLLNERHGIDFVPYLRLAILRWGGFPGLEGRDERWNLVEGLTEGLEPF